MTIGWVFMTPQSLNLFLGSPKGIARQMNEKKQQIKEKRLRQ